jgi:DNA-binding MarR family transcriptional regulator
LNILPLNIVRRWFEMKDITSNFIVASTGSTARNIWVFLLQTRDIIYRTRGKELRPYGLTVMDAGLLFFIDYLGDKATPAELSRWVLRKHHTVVAQLNRMEKKGLITSTKGIIQKNVITVNLTEKGREALENSKNVQSLTNIFSVISEEESKQLLSILGKIREAAVKEIAEGDKYYYPIPPT